MLSVLVSPLFYLIPLAIGATMLWWASRVESRVAFVALSVLYGMVVLTRLFQSAEERQVLIHVYLAVVAGVFFVLGASAWRCVGSFSVPKTGEGLSVPKVGEQAILVAALIILPAYVYFYFIVSAFPFTDIFQNVHPMKAANEFARTHVLNGLDGASYIPVRPVLEGFLISIFGYDPIVGIWALAPLTAGLKLAVAWQASRLAHAGSQMIAFIALGGSLFSFDMTNGVLCALGSILLFVGLVEIGDAKAEPTRQWSKSIAILVLSLAGLALWKLLGHNAQLTTMTLVAGPAAISAAWLLGYRSLIARKLLLIFVLLGILVSLHRSSMLLIPIAAASAAIWTVRGVPLVTKSALVVSVLSAAFISFTLVVALLEHAGALPTVVKDVQVAFMEFASRATGSDDDVKLGLGVKNALIETVRAMGPAFCLTVGAVLVFSAVSGDGRKLWREPEFAVPVALMLALIGGVLTGFPFAYRSVFFAGIFAAVAVSAAVPRLWIALRQPLILIPVIPVAMALCYAVAMYGVKSLSPYAHFYLPVLITLLLIGAFVATTWIRRRTFSAVGLMMLAALVVSADRIGAFSISLAHSYGVPPAGISTVSHYSAEELRAARSLSRYPPQTLLVSDPFTASIVRAVTGFNVPYAYSNLDTMVPHYERNLRRVLRASASGDRDGYCEALREMMPAAGDYENLINRMGLFKDRINSVVVYSRRTAIWMRDIPSAVGSYYPSPGELDGSIKDALASLGTSEEIDDAVVMVPVTCMRQPAQPG
jgi:hypothetical protein